MKTYRIIRGSFRVSPTKTLGIGETIELEDDVAVRHADQLELVKPAAVPVPAPAAAPAAKA